MYIKLLKIRSQGRKKSSLGVFSYTFRQACWQHTQNFEWEKMKFKRCFLYTCAKQLIYYYLAQFLLPNVFWLSTFWSQSYKKRLTLWCFHVNILTLFITSFEGLKLNLACSNVFCRVIMKYHYLNQVILTPCLNELRTMMTWLQMTVFCHFC